MIKRLLTPRSFFIITLLLTIAAAPAFGQSTAFTYQGKLTDSGNLANGSYDLQFKLFDALTGGTQQATQTVTNVTVTNGTFTVTLDFGACPACFNGAARFLEIAVQPTGGGGFVTLSPRQQITSTPYAIKSANAASADGLSVACVSCVNSSQIQSVSGSAVTGTIPVASVPAGSANYIQNGTSQQAASNFNVSGTGTANILNAATQFNLNGNRVLSAAGSLNLFAGVNAGTANTANFNTFVGAGAGQANTTGDSDAFFGSQAGVVNTTGFANSFFGRQAGFSNVGGNNNSFFGASAGQANTSGFENAFFGRDAGFSNTTGNSNSFFGLAAGRANVTGNNNSFFGKNAGLANTASDNSFFGFSSGAANTSGAENTFMGRSAGLANTTGSFNAFVGTFTGQTNVSGSNNSFFGRAAGSNSTTSDNSFFGTSAGQATTTGGSNTFLGRSTGQSNTVGFGNTFVGGFSDFSSASPTGDFNVLLGYLAKVNSGVFNASAIGANAQVTLSNSLVLGSINGVNGATADTNVGIGTTAPADRLHVNGIIRVQTLGAADTTTTLCRNSLNQIATCNSSSLRYKTNISAFTGGLDVVKQLRPIYFTWKQSGIRDLGFGAEEVAKVEPLFTFTNEQGQIEGVKYDRINVALVNAVKELAAENDALKQKLNEQQTNTTVQQQQLRQQQKEIAAIKKLLCQSNPQADLCKATLK